MDYSFGDVIDTAQGFGSGFEFDTPRNAETATSNAIQSSQPIDGNTGGSWGGFWQNTLGSITGYAVARDMQQRQVQNGSVAVQNAAVQQRTSGNGLLMLAGVGVLAFLLIDRAR